jgi:FlaA1/EpsC-like NDP-sugar epimerase
VVIRLSQSEDIVKYRRFAAMIATSTIIMFGLMYLNTYVLQHVRFSETRLYMALLMGAVMAIVMMLFMLKMYENKRANMAILAGSVVVFAVSLWLVRSQETVGDVAYMKAMIPHHSIAIMTSERAHIKDPEVRKLADGIIDAQIREIAEMDRMIARLEAKPTPANTQDLPSYRDRHAPPPPPQTDQSTGINTLKPIE